MATATRCSSAALREALNTGHFGDRSLCTSLGLLLPSRRQFSTVQRPSWDAALARFRPRIASSPSSAAPFHSASPHPLLLRSGNSVDARDKEPVPGSPPETDFTAMDMLGSVQAPANAVALCRNNGFLLESGARIDGGDGAVLVGGEAFRWRPWRAGMAGDDQGDRKTPSSRRRLINGKGQWEVPEEAWALFRALWPRPDLLILGVGPKIRPLSPATKETISNMGMRVEVLDTRNAASQFNMLATERGVDEVAAALIPVGWREGVGTG